MDDPNSNIAFLLHDVARLLRQRFEQNSRALQLTRSQCQVLAYLARREGIQQGELAALLEIEPITLTRLVDRLEQGRLVERRSHPRDRRVRLLYLTAEARPLIGDIFAVGAATRAEALEQVSEEDRALLFDILGRMKTNLLRKLDAERTGERKASHG
ncbi:MAG: MarR family transcriptional regulator [Reyranellaceae bacterium]